MDRDTIDAMSPMVHNRFIYVTALKNAIKVGNYSKAKALLESFPHFYFQDVDKLCKYAIEHKQYEINIFLIEFKKKYKLFRENTIGTLE